MRRIAALSVICLAIVLALTACKQAVPADTETAVQSDLFAPEAVSQPSASSENSGTSLNEQADAPAAHNGTDTSSVSDTADAQTSRQGNTGGSAETPDEAVPTASASSAATIKPDETPETVPSSASAGTTVPGTTKKNATDTTTQTTAQTPNGSSSGSKASSSSKSTAQTTAARPSDTESDEVKPVSDDKAVSGTLSYLNNAPVTYLSAINDEDLKNAFHITGDKKDEILEKKKDWEAYTIQIDFRNNTDKPLTIYYLNVTDNGKDDIYICGDTAGELGMPSGGKISEKFYLLAPKSYSDIDVREKLSDMTMKVQYAETPKDDNMVPKIKEATIG